SVWQEFLDVTGVRIINGLGTTEMLHIFVSAADDDIRPGATGRAVPGYETAVLAADGQRVPDGTPRRLAAGPGSEAAGLDADGQPVPDGTPGRLAVTGPTGCRYLADARQTSYVQH